VRRVLSRDDYRGERYGIRFRLSIGGIDSDSCERADKGFCQGQQSWGTCSHLSSMVGETCRW